MSAAAVAQTIQFIIAPVVMVTAAGILFSAFQVRNNAVNERLRALMRERLDLLRENARTGPATDVFLAEPLDQIDVQVPWLVAHHRLIHFSLLSMSSAVLAFVASMFVIGAAAANASSELATVALVLFFAATAVFLLSVGFTTLEVRDAQRSLEYEIERVSSLRLHHAERPDGEG